MTPIKKQQNHNGLNLTKTLKAKLIAGLVITLVVFALLPQVGSLKEGYQTISRADLRYILYALLFVGVSYLPASMVYVFISYFRLRFWRTVLVQVANGFTNRTLPAGAGGIATSALYLIKQKHGQTKAGYLAGLNNVLGAVGHGLIFFLIFVMSPVTLFSSLDINISRGWLLAVGLCVLTLVLLFVAFKKVRRLTNQAYKSVTWLLTYSLEHPIKLLLGLVCAMATTICYALVLYYSALAVDVHLSAIQIFFVLTVGVVSIAITPTPGGLGGAEAALTASMVAIDVEPAYALSVTLIYRMLTYWLPILPGFVAFQFILKRKYI
jgi:glycosyltransferase 2 family protein